MRTGVIEGFYGRPWSEAARHDVMDWSCAAGMTTFIYAPKDDVHVRARWRSLYNPQDLERLRALREAADARGLTLQAAISPCLDITHSDATELALVIARVDQLRGIGISDIVLLFDDIPTRLNALDAAQFTSFAAAQVHVVNAVWAHIGAQGPGSLTFCPTEYCGRFADPDVAHSAYLGELGRTLESKIDIFWTGPEIVSEQISAASLREIGAVLRRKPVIWDNFYANDYDLRRVHLGPLAGREADILPLVAGWIMNPNNEAATNFVPIADTGRFLRDQPLQSPDVLVSAWQPHFTRALKGNPVPAANVALLIDLFWQPFALGPETTVMVETARRCLQESCPDTTAPDWQRDHASLRGFRDRIITLFDDLTELADRELFHALHPYIWEAREEITHLATYLDWLAKAPNDAHFDAGGRIHNFYRLGFGAAVQELVPRGPSGKFDHRFGRE